MASSYSPWGQAGFAFGAVIGGRAMPEMIEETHILPPFLF